jgi:hypothetical protein
MGQLQQVQPAGHQVGGHRAQVRDQVIEREQVAGGVEHADGQAEPVREREVPHVGLVHLQFQPGRPRLTRGVAAHRAGDVERGRAQPAGGEFPGMLGRARGELQHRAGPCRLPPPVLGAPGDDRLGLGRHVPVGARKPVQVWFVVDAAHVSNHAPRRGVPRRRIR